MRRILLRSLFQPALTEAAPEADPDALAELATRVTAPRAAGLLALLVPGAISR